MCNVILYFTLLFNDGHVENRVKYVDKEVAAFFIQYLNNSDQLKEIGVKKAINIIAKSVPEYDCNIRHNPNE